MTTTLLTINFDYSRDVDVSQVWAQAVALYKSGDLGKLSREDAKRIAAINDEYAFEPVSYDWLNRYIEDSPESFVPTYEITMAMKSDMDIRSDNQLTREIAGWMVKHGYKEGRSRVDVASDDHGKLLPSKKMVRGYFGAKLTPPHKLTIYDKRGGVGSSL